MPVHMIEATPTLPVSSSLTLCTMKHVIAVFLLSSLATLAGGSVNDAAASHPLYGKWKWTYASNHCTETYDYRPDNTSIISSGEEQAESRFTISDKPDQKGFYRMTDVTTKSNGRAGCDGAAGGTPVGDSAVIFIFFNPTKSEMIICQEPSFNACMGPLRRVSQ